MNEEKKNVFTIQNEEGKEITCEVLFTFDSESTKKSYVVYTDNTYDEEGSIKVYASIYDPSGKDNTLQPIETEEEWHAIEDILAKIEETNEE